MSKYTLLIAEDNAAVAEALRNILSEMNIDCKIVESGEDLIEQYSKAFYDMVLVDILMPGMDGFAASKYIRSQNSTIPIIAFTSLSLMDIREKMAQSGINHYIGKPEDFEMLKPIIAKYFTEAA